MAATQFFQQRKHKHSYISCRLHPLTELYGSSERILTYSIGWSYRKQSSSHDLSSQTHWQSHYCSHSASHAQARALMHVAHHSHMALIVQRTGQWGGILSNALGIRRDHYILRNKIILLVPSQLHRNSSFLHMHHTERCYPKIWSWYTVGSPPITLFENKTW